MGRRDVEVVTVPRMGRAAGAASRSSARRASTARSRSRRWRRSSSASCRSGASGSTSPSGTASGASSRTRRASSGSGRGTRGPCSATSRSSRRSATSSPCARQSTARSSSSGTASSTSTRCRPDCTPRRAGCASSPPRSRLASSRSTFSCGTGSSTGRRRSRSAGRRSRRSRTDLTLSPVTLDLDEALSWLDSFEAIGLDGVIAKRRDKPYAAGSREAVAKVKPEKTADCVVAGLRWKADGERRIATLLLGLYDDDGDLDYVGSAVVAPARHDEIAAAVTPLLQNAPERRFSEPNRWGGGELEETAVRPELVVEVRYDKVQGRRFRHGTKLMRLRPGQEPGAVHVARAPPAARGGRLHARAAPRLVRVRRLLRARGLHARRLTGHLREVRRIRRLPDSFRLLAFAPSRAGPRGRTRRRRSRTGRRQGGRIAPASRRA